MGKKVNKKDLVEIIGVSSRTVSDWQKDETFPYEETKRGVDNIYDTELVIGWIVAKECGDDYAGNLDQERTRLTKAQADKTEIEVEKLIGDVIPKDNVELIIVTIATNFRSKMLALPSKLSSILAAENKAKKTSKILRDEINEALEELTNLEAADILDMGGEDENEESEFSESEQSSGNDSDHKSDTGSSKAAANLDSKPVGGKIPDTDKG